MEPSNTLREILLIADSLCLIVVMVISRIADRDSDPLIAGFIVFSVVLLAFCWYYQLQE